MPDPAPAATASTEPAAAATEPAVTVASTTVEPTVPAADPAPAEPASTDPAPMIPADPEPTEPAATTEPAEPTEPGDPNETGDPDDSPDHPDGKSYTEGYVKGLRTEAANYRTKLRDAEARYDDLVANLGKLGGFTPDEAAAAAEGGEPAPQDPAAALEAITAERDADRAKLRDYAQRDAVRAAAGEDVDSDALLDSASFLSEVGQLDHSADDYAAQVAAAVASFVKAHPRFTSAPAVPARSGGDTSQTNGESVQLTDAQFAALSAEARLKALEDGRYRP